VAYLLKEICASSGGEFEKTLQDDQDLTTGRLDTRFSGPNLNPLSESAEYDPQSSAISSAYVSLFNDYVRRDLKYGEGQTYLPEALFNGAQWDFKHNGNPIDVNVAPDLAEAMKTNPRLKVMVNGGYYDLATPFFAAQYEEKAPADSAIAGEEH
jgi:carboxypeptidase C (cathepsin A)